LTPSSAQALVGKWRIAPGVVLARLKSRMRLMSDWYVVYTDEHGREDAKSRAMPSKEAALSHARDLMRRGSVDRIEGPNGEVVRKEEIERWAAANPL
jgi:hypothetical protein